MLSDWLKTQKKPTRTNQIRAVLTAKIQENGHGYQQTTTGFNFVSKTTIEKLKKYSKNPNTVKSTSFCRDRAEGGARGALAPPLFARIKIN